MKNHAYSIVALLLGLLISFSSMAQKKAGSQSVPQKTEGHDGSKSMKKHREMGKMGLQFQDPQPMKMAYYHALALYPDSTQYLDSLAILYFSAGQFQQCIFVSREILEKKSDNLTILEIKAVSEKNLGLARMALEDYEKLYPSTQNIQHLYQIASLQYELKRLGECQNSIQVLLGREDLKNAKVTVFFGQGQSQQVQMEAAIYNMAGVILLELKEPEKSGEMFTKALELEPDFVLAKNNQTLLEKQKESKD